MEFLNKEMMKVKLEIEGVTYYFSNAERLAAALSSPGGAQSFSLIRNANYVVSDGQFQKNRSSGDQLPNAILLLGRDKINELFDFMEGK